MVSFPVHLSPGLESDEALGHTPVVMGWDPKFMDQ